MFQNNVEQEIEDYFNVNNNIVVDRRAIIYQRNIQRRFLRDHMNPFIEDPEYFRGLYR